MPTFQLKRKKSSATKFLPKKVGSNRKKKSASSIPLSMKKMKRWKFSLRKYLSRTSKITRTSLNLCFMTFKPDGFWTQIKSKSCPLMNKWNSSRPLSTITSSQMKESSKNLNLMTWRKMNNEKYLLKDFWLNKSLFIIILDIFFKN